MYVYQQRENDRLCIQFDSPQIPNETPDVTIEMTEDNEIVIKVVGETVYSKQVGEDTTDTEPGPEEGGDDGDDDGDGDGDGDDGEEVSTADDLKEALTKGGEITIENDIDCSDSFEVVEDTTINLNGKTITSDATVFTVKDGATLTIEGGTITSDIDGVGNTSIDNEAAIYVENGTVEIKDADITSTSIGVKAEDGASVTIGEGTTITSEYFALWLGGDKAEITIEDGATIEGIEKGIVLCGDSSYGHDGYQTGAVQTLNIEGGELSCEYDSVICTLGVSNAESSIINITGGTLTGADDGKTPFPTVFIPNGTLTISGNPVISGSTPIEVRGGTTRIEGGTFNCTATGDSTTGYNASGATSYGYAISVFPYFEVTSNGETVDNDVDVVITDGTFEGSLYGATEEDYECTKATYKDYTFEIIGGKFTDDPTAYVPEDYEVEEADGYYTVEATYIKEGY